MPDTIPYALTPNNLSLIKIQYRISQEYDLELSRFVIGFLSLCHLIKFGRKGLLKDAPSFIHNLKEKYFFVHYPTLMLGLLPWGFLRKSVCRASSLDKADLDSSNKLKTYQAPLLPDLLKEQILFNLGLSPLDPTEMDTEVVGMLTKGLYAQKRKGKAPSGSSKRAKADASSSTIPTTTTTFFEAAEGIEVVSTTKVGATGGGLLPPTALSPPVGDQVLEPPTKREKGKEKKRKNKLAVMKIPRKARSSKPNDSGDDLGEDPFDNPKIVRDLTDKFTMSEVVDHMADLDQTQLVWSSLGTFLKSGHQILAHIKKVHYREVEALKARRTFKPRSIASKRRRPPRPNASPGRRWLKLGVSRMWSRRRSSSPSD
ncbi:hypothetical protein COCNU_04G010140 [Cocos nucifera]|uniref:Uncharacterized protein n=1 Tax=Cocos nucifera TaxID=13894 RepID=A0A8K0I656_COCNU|nr:hypothetical protein COCNU_04G010140 [Cocos nucifera]